MINLFSPSVIFSFIVLMMAIPIILKIRDYIYKKKGYTKSIKEDMLFTISMFGLLQITGHCLSNEFITVLSAPFLAYFFAITFTPSSIKAFIRMWGIRRN